MGAGDREQAEAQNGCDKNKFGFMPGGRQYRQSICSCDLWLRRSIGSVVGTFTVFVDLEKAYDSMQQDVIWRSLEKRGYLGGVLERYKTCMEGRRLVLGRQWVGRSTFW